MFKPPVMLGATPNIIGNFQGGDFNEDVASGAFFFMEATNSRINGSNYRLDKVGFDASRSNPLYGKELTVQVASMRALACIKT